MIFLLTSILPLFNFLYIAVFSSPLHPLCIFLKVVDPDFVGVTVAEEEEGYQRGEED